MFPPGSEIPPLHLTSLNLTLRRDPPNSNLLCALIGAASATLTTLELDLAEPGQPGAGNDLAACLDAFLPLIASTLLRLSLIVHAKVDGIERVLEPFTALESCRIEFRNELDHLPLLHDVADAVPTSVAILSLVFERRINPEPELGVLLAMITNSLPKRPTLKKVELLGISDTHTRLPVAFLAECESRGIEVVVKPREVDLIRSKQGAALPLLVIQ